MTSWNPRAAVGPPQQIDCHGVQPRRTSLADLGARRFSRIPHCPKKLVPVGLAHDGGLGREEGCCLPGRFVPEPLPACRGASGNLLPAWPLEPLQRVAWIPESAFRSVRRCAAWFLCLIVVTFGLSMGIYNSRVSPADHCEVTASGET